MSSPIALALAACEAHLQDRVKQGTEPGARADVDYEMGQDAEKDQQKGLQANGKEEALAGTRHPTCTTAPTHSCANNLHTPPAHNTRD